MTHFQTPALPAKHLSYARLGRFHDRQTLIIKVDRHPVPERVLKRRRNLGRLIRIIRGARKRLIIKDGRSELGKVVNKRPVVKHESIRRRRGPHAVRVTHLDAVDGRVPVDDGVRLCAAHAGAALEAVGEGAAEVRGQDLAVGELDHCPAVVAVAVLGEVAVDGLLAHGDDAVDLLLGVFEAGLYVEVVAADVDLRIELLLAGLVLVRWVRLSGLRRGRPCRRRDRRTAQRRR